MRKFAGFVAVAVLCLGAGVASADRGYGARAPRYSPRHSPRHSQAASTPGFVWVAAHWDGSGLQGRWLAGHYQRIQAMPTAVEERRDLRDGARADDARDHEDRDPYGVGDRQDVRGVREDARYDGRDGQRQDGQRQDGQRQDGRYDTDARGPDGCGAGSADPGRRWR